MVASTAATWMLVGKVSLLDWLAFTWSLGCTSTPAFADSEASTSFMFMFELVPEPVWKTSIGKASWCWPPMISSAPAAIARARSSVMMPSSALIRAAAFFTRAIATTCDGSRVVPLIGKFSTARWVCARHSASRGTSMSPMLSCSVRVWVPVSGLMAATLPATTQSRRER